MLLFIYSDELPDVCEVTRSTTACSSMVMVQHLLAAADRFGLDRLKLLCEAKLSEEVTAETLGTTLALAEQHQCSLLKAICLKYAASPVNLGGVFLRSMVHIFEGYLNFEQNSCYVKLWLGMLFIILRESWVE